MQKVSLYKLNKFYRIKDITSMLVETFKLSELQVECFYLTQAFLDVNATKKFERLIQVKYSAVDNKYELKADEELETKDWFWFATSGIEFDCDSKIAFGVVLVYMNAIHANDIELKVGLKGMVSQIWKNENKYHPQH